MRRRTRMIVAAVLLLIASNLVAFTGWRVDESGAGTPGLQFQRIGVTQNVEVRRGTANVTHIEIPQTVTVSGVNYAVTQIAGGGFQAFTAMTSLTIPSSVTTIGVSAFQDTRLQSITVVAGNAIFRSEGNCLIRIVDNSLIVGTTNSIIPNGVVRIGTSAFSGNTDLTNIIIPNSVTSIGASAFENTGLSTIVIPNSVISMDNSVFANNANLTSVTLGNGLTSIPESAFIGATNLTNITIPNSVTNIGSYAFRNTGLTNVVIPNSVTNMGVVVFADNANLTSVTLGNSLQFIPFEAFMGNGNLTSINIPNSVSWISMHAFANCVSLTRIVIPISVTYVSNSVFFGSPNLIIYSEAPSRPADWNANWNPDDLPVIWNYEIEDDIDLDLNPPLNPTWSKVRNNITLSWQAPADMPAYKQFTHGLDDIADEFTAIGTGAPATFGAYQRFTPAQLTAMGIEAGSMLTMISFLSGDVFAGTQFNIRVLIGGSGAPLHPEWVVYEITRNNIPSRRWNHITLSQPIEMPQGQELWIGYDVVATGGHPAGALNDAMVNNFGNVIFVNNQWTTLYADNGHNGNWGIKGFAETNDGRVRIAGFENTTVTNHHVEGDMVSLQAIPVASNTRNIRGNHVLTGYKVHWFDHVLGVMNVTSLNTASLTHIHNGVPAGSWIYGVSAVYNSGESEIVYFNNGSPIIVLGGVLVVNPNSHDFGQIGVREMASQTFTIENTGDVELTIDSISIVGGGSAFNIVDMPDNLTIHATESLDLVVRFAPTEAINYQAQIIIQEQNDGETYSILLKGEGSSVSEDDMVDVFGATALLGNFPNPFNPETVVSFVVASDAFVSIEIFNIRGQRVRTLVNGYMNSGEHSVVWNGRDDNDTMMGSGIYFYRMTAGDYQSVRRMILMK